MSRYTITNKDTALAIEFLEDRVGYHSPDLQRLLNLMRTDYADYKYVLVVLEQHRRWGLGRLPLTRGKAIEIVDGVEYTDILDAERDVFKRRWHDLTQQDLDSLLSDHDTGR